MKHHETDFFAKELMMAGDVPFEDRRPTLLETARNYLEHHRALCQQLHQSGAGGREVVARVTEMSDVLIQSLYQCAIAEFHEAGKSCATVIALGGYGRSELNPLSDIDVMFFCSDKNKDLADQAAQRLLYLLWDLNLDVGNSVRTARDCMSLAQQDLTIRTSLLDARYITGDTDLYADFERNVLQPLLTKNTQSFLDEKFQEHETRRNKYGSSVYMLEPNLKEGEGGLRDLQTAVWMARVKFKANSLRELLTKGIISDQEMMEIEQAHDYLWNIRNHLHFLSKRKNDQLQYDKQTEIAAFLGYENNRRAPSVEQFLQDYYAHATHVEHLASTLVMRTCKSPSGSSRLMGYLARRNLGDDFFSYWGELKSARKNLFTERPEAMMLAFLLAKQNDLQLSAELKGNIRSHLELVNDKFRRSRRISGMFLQILAEPGGIARTLRDMHHLTFLNRYIPEFAKIYCKVQYDAYHVYTIDIHTIFAIEELEKLWDGVYLKKKPLFTSVARDIGKRELLVLAVLFHDIGKGEGKSHADKGADMVPKIARRFHLKKEDSERLEFLVRRHLDMAHISQRRDLNDDRLIQDFANTMGMAETLKMLFLLTFADLKAVGPDVWSEWKGFLLQELYEKTYEVLERGNFMSDVRSERIRNRKRKVTLALKDEFSEKVVRSYLRSMNARYLLTHRSWEIAEHATLELSRREETVALKVNHDFEAEYTNVVISTVDVPGLFSMLAGVMAANGINILGAQIYTRNNGCALDILHVNKPIGGVIDDDNKWQKVHSDLVAVLEGRVRVSALVEKRETSSSMPMQKRPTFPDKVEFDCDVSREHTVIDIFTRDRVGLLYYITRTLADLGLYIHVAKISTKVDQVADTFYVKDIFGQPLNNAEKREEVRQALLECMSEQA